MLLKDHRLGRESITRATSSGRSRRRPLRNTRFSKNLSHAQPRCFQKLHSTIHKERDGTKRERVSRKTLTRDADESVVRVSVGQGEAREAEPRRPSEQKAPKEISSSTSQPQAVDFDKKMMLEKATRAQKLFRNQQNDIQLRIDRLKDNSSCRDGR